MTVSIESSTPRRPIALLIPSLRGGGAERVFTTLANAFVEETDHPIHMVLVRKDGVFRDHLRPEVEVVDLDTGRVSRALPKLISYLRARNPAAMMSTLNYCNVMSVIAWTLAARPCRLVLREASVPTTASRFMRLLMRLTYPQADVVVALSPEVKQHLYKAGIPVEEKVVEIGNPVVLGQPRPAVARLEFLPRPAPPFICAVGRLTRVKGFDVLLSAFARLEDSRMHLVILGEGEMRRSLEERADTLGIGERVHLPGFVDHPQDVVREAELFVLASRWEGFPNVLLEALSTGTPVVATDCDGAPRSLLDDGKYGHLVAPDDSDALIEGIRAALAAPRGASGARIARAGEFAADRIARVYLRKAFGV